MKKTLLVLLSSALLWFATASSAFACAFWHYQPEVPESLLK